MRATPLSNLEELCLWLTGKIICGVGFVGFFITLFFEQIARGMPMTYWSFQWLSITGLISFILLTLFGLFTDSFLTGPVRAIILEWAKR